MDLTKRYALFSGYAYYPEGGWDDLRGTFDTPEAAEEAVNLLTEDMGYRWYHVVDLEAREEVTSRPAIY